MSKASPRHIKTSADGSLTLWVPKLDEYYHSIHGALTESQHVFINAGLKSLTLPEVRVLEVGLGTALNARLTLEQKGSTLIHYTALEKFPLSTEEIDLIARSNMQQEGLILRCEPFVPTELIPGFHFELITTDLDSSTARNPALILSILMPLRQVHNLSSGLTKSLKRCLKY